MAWKVRRAGDLHWTLDNGEGHTQNFRTREAAEAKLAEMRANGTCVECGTELEIEYMEPYRTRILTRQLCFNCLFWAERVEERDRPETVRVQGHHYSIAPETGNDGNFGFRGYGGTRFHIAFHDGRTVTTTNLWSQGVIPAHYRDRLPDNADFIKDALAAAAPAHEKEG